MRKLKTIVEIDHLFYEMCPAYLERGTGFVIQWTLLKSRVEVLGVHLKSYRKIYREYIKRQKDMYNLMMWQGHIEILHWITNHKRYPTNTRILFELAKTRDDKYLQVFSWIVTNRKYEKLDLTYIARSYNNMTLLQFLYDRRYDQRSNRYYWKRLIKGAIWNEDLGLLQWAKENNLLTEEHLYTAIQDNKMKSIFWYLSNNCPFNLTIYNKALQWAKLKQTEITRMIKDFGRNILNI